MALFSLFPSLSLWFSVRVCACVCACMCARASYAERHLVLYARESESIKVRPCRRRYWVPFSLATIRSTVFTYSQYLTIWHMLSFYPVSVWVVSTVIAVRNVSPNASPCLLRLSHPAAAPSPHRNLHLSWAREKFPSERLLFHSSSEHTYHAVLRKTMTLKYPNVCKHTGLAHQLLRIPT